MYHKTYGEVKDRIAKIAGQSGLKVSDNTRLLDITNETLELLWNSDTAQSALWHYSMEVYDNRIALPLELEKIVKAAFNTRPLNIHNHYYEYMRSGPGVQYDENKWVDVLIDRRYSAVARQPNGNFKIRIYASNDERVSGTRPKVLVKGFDQNGLWVRTYVNGAWQDGELIELRGDVQDNYADSATVWSDIREVLKPVTNGRVLLHYVDGATEYFGAEYPWWVTVPQFHIYELPSQHLSTQINSVEALCLRRLTPVRFDDDIMPIGNPVALTHGVLAVNYRIKVDGFQLAEYHENKARKAMQREAEMTMQEPQIQIDRDDYSETLYDRDYQFR